MTESINGNAVPVDQRSLSDIHLRHAELIAKGNGNPKNLANGELEELVEIFAVLRRRSSGPPSAKAKKPLAPAGALEDLL